MLFPAWLSSRLSVAHGDRGLSDAETRPGHHAQAQAELEGERN